MMMNGPANEFTPLSDSVATVSTSMSVPTALDNATTSTIDSANSEAALTPAGAESPHSPRPTSGISSPAVMIIGTARSSGVAVRRAALRAYQNAYESTGRRRSYATSPDRIMRAISGSTDHGRSVRN